MIAGLQNISQQCGSCIDVIDHYIDRPIVKDIPECRAPGGNHIRKATPRCWGHLLEFLSVNVSEKLRALGPGCTPILLVHFRIHVPVGNKKVKPAVIVVVEKAGSPGQKWSRRTGRSEERRVGKECR